MLALVLGAMIAAAPPQLDREAVAACLGTPAFALNMTTLALARAQVGEARWQDACRAAREANTRRRAAIEAVLATGRSPIGAYPATIELAKQAHSAPSDVQRQLFTGVARDQAGRESTLPAAKAAFAPGASPLVLQLVDGLSSADALQADAANQAWLAKTVDERGWFTISRDGPEADRAAQLIVRHADADPVFQRRMLHVLEPLAEKRETDRRSFAFTFDRWARSTRNPQRFGIMGDCSGAGVWTPRPTEDPAGLDQRRAWAGLPPMAAYVAEQAGRCR
jgi:hypothetical protein